MVLSASSAFVSHDCAGRRWKKVVLPCVLSGKIRQRARYTAMERKLREQDDDSGYDPDRDANHDWSLVVLTVAIICGFLAVAGIVGLGLFVLDQVVSLI